MELVAFGAQWYDPQIGRFISPDTIIPDPAESQSFNRYAYVRNNPLRYTDPTGYFEEDEIRDSLTDQYGEEEADRIWELWQEDPGFLWALSEAEFGDGIWASDMWLDGPAQGHGVFTPGENGRILVTWFSEGRERTDLELYQLQGRGGYQLDKGDGIALSSCSNEDCAMPQGRYTYVDGIPYGGANGGPNYTVTVRWDHTEFFRCS